MHELDALPRPHRVVGLRHLPGLARFGVPVGIGGPIDGGLRDVVHLDVVGVRVAALLVAVGEDHLRPRPPDDPDQAAHGFIHRGLGEAERVGVGLAVGHARVAVAEHLDLVVADDGGGLVELRSPHGRDVGLHLGLVHRRVEDVALLAAGAAHEHGAHPLGVVAGDGASPLGRLVVRVGVDREEAERFSGHRGEDIDGGLRFRCGRPGSADRHRRRSRTLRSPHAVRSEAGQRARVPCCSSPARSVLEACARDVPEARVSGHVRAALATLASAPWRRAPLLLRRTPGVLLSVAGASRGADRRGRRRSALLLFGGDGVGGTAGRGAMPP